MSDTEENTTDDVFVTRPGAVDQGRDYEKNIIVHFLLKLVSNEDIKNFKISSNATDFGAFDDVILEIDTKNEKKEYAIQLKHFTGGRRRFSSNSLKNTNGKFSLEKYIESWEKDLQDKSHKMILFTNNKCDFEEESIDLRDKVKIKTNQHEVDPLINTSEKGGTWCHKFDVLEEQGEKYKRFFENFFVYGEQADASRIRTITSKKFQDLFNGDNESFERFLLVVTEWYNGSGKKRKLDMVWAKRTIALCLIPPQLIQPISSHRESEKSKILAEAISRFDVTFVKSTDVVSIWDCDLDHSTFNSIKKTYNLAFINFIGDINEAKESEKSLVLWLAGKCPLIVLHHPQVLTAIELSPIKNFVLITEDSGLFGNLSTFSNLSNLDHDSISKIADNFYYSLQGKEATKLSFLLDDHDELSSMITTDMLLTMLTETITIGEGPEELPSPHIYRNLSKTVISAKYLKNVEREDQKILIVLSCKGNYDKIKNNIKNFKLFVNKPMNEQCIYITEECSPQTFDTICHVNKSIKHCHHFRVTESGDLEWVKTKGNIEDLEPFVLDGFFTPELELYNPEPGNNINVICAKPGMGKSILSKTLKNKMSPKFWAVIIHPSDIATYFREGHTDFDDYIERRMCRKLKHFDIAVMMSFKKNRQIAYIWDGLDEITDQHFKKILEIIDKLSNRGYLQWITSRCHLQEKLERRFKVFARTITEFDDQQQNKYIEERLKRTQIKNIRDVIRRIKDNVRMIQSDEVLGIPLQIYMLTELFCQDVDKYLQLLENVFSLTDLYQHFVNEKFNRFYKEKASIGKINDSLRQILDSYRDNYLKKYEKAALKAVFEAELLKELKINSDSFLKKMKEGGDGFGLITEVSDNKVPTFLHKSYAEYFVASYFFKNHEKMPNLKDVLFKERYTNVRFHFDLLMAKDCPAHIAVLYKNIHVLKKNEDKIKQRDRGGRSPLHLACSWGQQYPLLKTKDSDDDDNYQEINDSLGESVTEETVKTQEMIQYLVERCDCKEEDNLFQMNSLSYADAALCLFPLSVISQRETVNFGELINYRDVCTVLYYAVRFDYSHLLTLIRDIPLIKTQKRGQTLLHLCAEYDSRKCLGELLSLEKYQQMINTGDTFDVAPIRVACKKGHKEILEMFLRQEADLGNVCHLLELACKNGHDEIIEVLIKSSNMNIKADNRSISSLMQTACLKGYEKIVKFLLDIDVNVNINSRNGTPLFIAAQYGYEKTVEVLIKGGADVNKGNRYGSTPLHISCQKNYIDIVKLLLYKADINLTDNRNNAPLHVACKSKNEDLVQLLLGIDGIDVNQTNQKKVSPLHSACQSGSEKIVEMLIEAGATIDCKCSEGRTPLHFACQEGHIDVVKVLLGRNVDTEVLDGKGKRPLDLAQKGSFHEIVNLLTELLNPCNKKLY